jgi:recombination protein RecA
MVARAQIKEVKPAPSSYFVSDKPLDFIPSGCALLDQVLGGGWPLGRVSNLVGDRSSGKTLLAIEACANFVNTFDGRIRYCEAEAAFDVGYAEALGLPVGQVDFADEIRTVEHLFDDLNDTIKKTKGDPVLYIVDSLDALSDKAEMDRDIEDGSYGAAKAKKLSELFRKLIKDIEASRMHLLVISQLRDKIGVTFGETQQRTGGRALDFYASQVIWLADIGKIKKTNDNIERTIGINVRAKCKKNKVGLPFRDCDFPVIFGYGVDDMLAMTEWLIKIKQQDVLDKLGLPASRYKFNLNKIRDAGGEDAHKLRTLLTEATVEHWRRVETTFLPKSRKY